MAAASAVGLTVVRADAIDDPGQITLQIIDHLVYAKAAVADLTGHNPNVSYELAIRHVARLPTVRGGKVRALPFDTAQMQTIDLVEACNSWWARAG